MGKSDKGKKAPSIHSENNQNMNINSHNTVNHITSNNSPGESFWTKAGVVVAIVSVLFSVYVYYKPSNSEPGDGASSQNTTVIGDNNKVLQSSQNPKQPHLPKQVTNITGNDNNIEQITYPDIDPDKFCADGIRQYQDSIVELRQELNQTQTKALRQKIERDLQETEKKLSAFKKNCKDPIR